MSSDEPAFALLDNKILKYADILTAALVANESHSLPCWYRGQAANEWKLQPHIFRENAPTADESKMLGFFMQEAPAQYDRCPSESDQFGWLSLMCHYGLPTRLLDWTKSILVAAFFATDEQNLKEKDSDGAVWALSPTHLIAATASDTRIPGPDSELIYDLVSSAFEGGESPMTAMPVIPRKMDLRMVLQQSRFTIHGSAEPFEDSFEAKYLLRFTIPSGAKTRIQQELRLLGITRNTLFPDLASLAEETLKTAALLV